MTAEQKTMIYEAIKATILARLSMRSTEDGIALILSSPEGEMELIELDAAQIWDLVRAS